jgi:hypothetical protein
MRNLHVHVSSNGVFARCYNKREAQESNILGSFVIPTSAGFACEVLRA